MYYTRYSESRSHYTMPISSIKERHLLPAVPILSPTFCVVELEHQWVQRQGQIRTLPLPGRSLGLADLVKLYWMLDSCVVVSERHQGVILML